MKRDKKSLIFLLLIIMGIVSINNNTVSTVENINSLKNDGVTTVENFNSRLLKDSSSNTTGNLNDMSENSYIFESQKWLGESLLNVTCSSTGSADLFFYFTSDITRYSYYNNKNSIVWSDDFLTTYGKPLWISGNWDSWFLEEDIRSGIEITAGNKKSFLISIGDGDSFDVRIYIRLRATTNGSDNSYKINISDLLTLKTIESIAIGKQNITHFTVPAMDFKLFKFQSSIATNNIVLLNEITVNNSWSWIYWHDTLTNIWFPEEENFTISISREWMPLFNNFDLTGRSALGIIFNPAVTDLNFTYSSQLAINSSERIKQLTSSEPSMPSTTFAFNDSVNDAYFTFQINEGYFFDIFFRIDLNWSVSVDFYSLGTNLGQQDIINGQGVNGDEKLSIFFSLVSNNYQDKDSAAFIEVESYGGGWYVINGSLSPDVRVINKLSSLIGFHIKGTNMGVNPNVNVTIEILPRNVVSFSNGQEVGIGKTDAGQETAAFPFLQVREFNTVNWRRYQWELQAFNQSNLREDTYWFCGVDGDEYENNMNNSLYSPEINDTDNYTDLKIEAKISYELAPGGVPPLDRFAIYVKNTTHRELLDEYVGDSGGYITYSKDISNWTGWNFTIEFNLNTNAGFGRDKGATIDDFEIIGNSSLIIYENNFESSLSGWTHEDHSGEGDLWHVVTEEVGINEPVVDIVYQESTYSMVGEKPSTSGVGAYPKIFFDKDPKVQPNTKSYLVYYANGQIQSNLTIKLSVNTFDIVSMTNNQIKFTNDFTYLEAEQQGNDVVNATKTLNRPRWYYKFNAVKSDYLIFELSENSILQGHFSITIAFYNQDGQTPFTTSYSETYTLQIGLDLSGQVRYSGMIIISIEDLEYNDYIELNVYAYDEPSEDEITFPPVDLFLPIVIIIILSIISVISITLILLLYRKYLAASRENILLKMRSKMKTPKDDTIDAKKPSINKTKPLKTE